MYRAYLRLLYIYSARFPKINAAKNTGRYPESSYQSKHSTHTKIQGVRLVDYYNKV